jgi:hypothetical protein
MLVGNVVGNEKLLGLRYQLHQAGWIVGRDISARKLFKELRVGVADNDPT